MSEERVEHALRGLGEDLRYTNPTRAVLRKTRRMRVRRNIVGGSGAALAVAALITPFAYGFREAPSTVALPGISASPPPTAPSPTLPVSKPAPPGAVALPGGVYVASASNDSGSRVYDPKSHRYRASGHPRAWVSPDGKLAVVADENGRLGILDLRGAAVRWIKGSKLAVGRPEWSSDARQVVFAGPGSAPDTLGIVLADVASARARTLRPAVPCWEFCQPSWLPGDKEVALPDANQPRSGLLAYAVADGRSRPVTLAGTVQTSSAWSPDGRHVVAAILRDDRASGVGIIDAATGDVAAELDVTPGDEVEARAVVWATTDQIVAVVARDLVVFSTEGRELRRIPLPSALRGVQNQLAFARP
ncbi:hypothetical protein [Asanoa iriomotensis]|uniref:WD40 repeat protein n=1 Tax=Asanoa iriomotensis TaxID=234613 RepID=A0ABQ4CCM7_9ACTN|nr:hypothetical protein [Asanoa iriomotensis]GIF60512.1 hypothetical protein Air01nite_66070 [Asanoa iriomotensis]